MSKIYIFGIGGTGARVIRSLTMLLAAGVEPGNGIDQVIPVIIDPDKSNGDLTRTITLLKDYKSINNSLQFGTDSKSTYFRTRIDDLDTNFRMEVADVADKDFQSYIKYFNLDPSNKALVSLLFSKRNLESHMDVGFKGNPNMGSVVLNNFSANASTGLGAFLQTFQNGDKIFIVSSIFGGTGASGFPLLLKTLRQAQNYDLPSAALVANAPIGAITVLPYFGVKHDEFSEINMDSFMSKAKSALSYYRDNLNCDALYYISDRLAENYDNHEGDYVQRNNAHFVEMAAALSIIDFCRTNIEHGDDPIYKEFGINFDGPMLSLKMLGDSTRRIIEKPLISMFIFEKFFHEHLSSRWDDAWAKDFEYGNDSRIDSSVMSHDFFTKLDKFLRAFHNEWLIEMNNNHRGFAPFNLASTGENIFNAVYDYIPKKTGFWGKITGKKLEGFDAIDANIADCSINLHKKLPLYDYFMEVHWQAINKELKTKYEL